jgi:hypothetical protein
MKTILIDHTQIQFWEENLKKNIQKMIVDQDVINWFLHTSSIDSKIWKNLLKDNSEKDFIRNYCIQKQMEDINFFKDEFVGENLEIIQCIPSKGTLYELKTNNQNINSVIFDADCYTNSFLYATAHNADLVYGIGESYFGIPALHMWNKIDSIYLDITWETQKKIGKKYYIIRILKPYEYHHLWSSMKRPPSSNKEWHETLMKDIDVHTAKKNYSEYRQDIIVRQRMHKN